MKLLVVGDIHGTDAGVRALNAYREEDVDCVAVCGDITHFGPAEWAVDVLSRVEVPLVCVAGNCDPPELPDVLKENGIRCLHFEVAECSGLRFTGFGGSPKGPSGPSVTEKEISGIAAALEGADVLITHIPAYGINDRVPSGDHLGSRALREAVASRPPKIHLSAHVHEVRNGALLEGTLFINPGPAKDGCYGVVATESLEYWLKSIY